MYCNVSMHKKKFSEVLKMLYKNCMPQIWGLWPPPVPPPDMPLDDSDVMMFMLLLCVCVCSVVQTHAFQKIYIDIMADK